MDGEPTVKVSDTVKETRKCSLCNRTLSRFFLTNNEHVQWQFKGDHAHLECYIDLHVQMKIKNNLDEMCNNNSGRFIRCVRGICKKTSEKVFSDYLKKEKKKSFISRIFGF